MIDHIYRFTVPAAYALLPTPMQSPEATAMLLATGLQESRFLLRRQLGGGPARGFWQFEMAGVLGIQQHKAMSVHLYRALEQLCYTEYNVSSSLTIVEHNDTLACVFARLLLWILPAALPPRTDPAEGWRQYISAWRPGNPKPETWDAYYMQAWELVSPLPLE